MARLSTLLLLSALLTLNASAVTYYVSTTGSDAANGTSDATPWRTINKAATVATAGDVVNIGAAVYAEDVTFGNSGTELNNIVFSGPGATLRKGIINGNYITIHGLRFGSAGLVGEACRINGTHNTLNACPINQMLVRGQNGLTVEGSYNVVTNSPSLTGAWHWSMVVVAGFSNTVVNCTVHDMDNADAFRMWGHGNVIRGNTVTRIENTDFAAFHSDFVQTFAYANNVVSSNNLVELNLVTDINGQVMQMNSRNDGGLSSPYIGWTTFRNNIFARMALSGFIEAPNIHVYNNIFYQTATNGLQEAALWIWGSGLHGSSYGGGEGSTIQNNAFIGCGSGDGPTYGFPKTEVGGCDYNFASTLAWGAKTILNFEPHGLTGFNPNFVDPVALNFALQANSGLIDRGVTIAGTQTDYSGTPRPQGAAFDIGPYEYVAGGTSPGTLSLSANTYTVSESDGSLTISVPRSGGTSGAVTCAYQTSNGTALAGTDYTLTSGTLSWAAGDGSTKTFSIPIANRTAGNRTFTIALSAPTGGATIGTPSSATVTINGTSIPLMPSLSFEAEAGLISAPFVVSGGLVSQAVNTLAPTAGGRARYRVTIDVAGDYYITANVNAPNTGSDSVHINFDSDPTTPTMIWDITPSTSGVQSRTVDWRGNGDAFAAQFKRKTWTLSAGEHVLHIRGREAGCQLDNIQIVQVPVTLPTVVGVSAPAGFYKAGSIIPITVRWSTPVTITGVPELLLNNAAVAPYVSGQGTTATVFHYTVQAGDDIASLDYDSIDALGLNGGTIESGGTSAYLPLPVPGEAGSLAASTAITIDTVAPAIVLGPASDTTTRGADRQFLVSYTDDDEMSITLAPAAITLDTTGTATATISVAGVDPQKIVTLSGITGTGTLQISIDASTATDRAGNACVAAGPSEVITVLTRRIIHVRSTNTETLTAQ